MIFTFVNPVADNMGESDKMIHTLTIKYRILSAREFDEIYKGLEARTGKKPRKIAIGEYKTEELRELGLSEIILTSKKIDTSKYKYNFMEITIRVNPVKLIGANKLEVLKHDQVEVVKKIFRQEVQKIHTNLPRLEHWTVNRIDYAVNINTPYVEEYIKLFQRADKPRVFRDWDVSRRKQRYGSFYLISEGVNINFYDKESERLSQNFNKDGAKDLLRIEVQCKKPKTNTLKTKYEFDSRHLEHYLSEEVSYQQLEYYYNKTIGAGDYYKLSEAIKMVKESNYTSKTKEKLTEVLIAVNRCRSIWKAREESQYNSSRFNRYLKQIRALGVNPVTIPTRWKVKFLPGLEIQRLKKL